MSEMKLRDRPSKYDQTKKTNQENDLEVVKYDSADIELKQPAAIGEDG